MPKFQIQKPKKSEVKFELEKSEVVEPIQETVEVELTHTAIGTFQVANGSWSIAIIKFDPVSGAATVESSIPAGTTSEEARERFYIETANNVEGF